MAVHIKAGSQLNGYTFTTDMTASDAGTSMWAFAENAGFDYFIKCYLAPTYPDDNAPGSEPTKQRKRIRCHAFETRIHAVEKVLTKCGNDNFLVPAVDFFRHDGSYYKVTKKIHSQKLTVSELPAETQLLILISAAYAVKMLHEKSDLVHGDIKPENLILYRTGERIIANLIDFDSGFLAEESPVANSLVGDQRYWPPELIEFLISKGTSGTLSQKLDVFSLGVAFCQYLCAQLPEFPPDFAYVGEAVLDGAEVRIPSVIHAELTPLAELIKSMLHKEPGKRPSAGMVHDNLRSLNQKLFITEKTFFKMTTLWKKGLASNRTSLGIVPLMNATRFVYKNGSELTIKGLNISDKWKNASRFRSKNRDQKTP